MLQDVVAVQPLDGYRLRLQFEDGKSGEVDVARLVTFQGVFAPLAEKGIFDQAYVDADLGTVAWPGGADIDPDVLYSLAIGQPPPDFRPQWSSD